MNNNQNTIWEELNQTGLFLEGTDEGIVNSPINAYVGVNVSKTENEPIDQILFFTTLKRIQNWNLTNFGEKGESIIFIGGLFEILNATNSQEVNQIIEINIAKEKEKQELYEKIIKKFGLNTKILITTNLWEDEKYWKLLSEQFENNKFTRGQLINDSLNFYNSKEQLFETIKVKELTKYLVNLPLEFIKRYGNWPAPIMYTPAEVTESLFINQYMNINMKVGQAQERVYDKYLINTLSTIRLKQSLALNSTRLKSIPVTPYIDKVKQKEEIRIFFNDTPAIVSEKVRSVNYDNNVYSIDENFGQTLNPIIGIIVYAFESGICQGENEIYLFEKSFKTGQEFISYLQKNEVSTSEITKSAITLVDNYVLNLTKSYEIS
jgi:hypothetical protein